MSNTLQRHAERDEDVGVDYAARKTSHGAPDSRRWISLTVIALAQLMVALDATIVSIALPSAQSALQVTAAERQ